MIADEARAFWVAEPGRGEIRAESLDRPGLDQVLVRAAWSGISRGTESLVFNGRVPPTERERMRAPFQQGDFPAPVKYGYASVGRVEAGAPTLIDKMVFALHPHQTRYIVPATAVHVLPDGVPPARAVLAANLETAVNGIWDARVQPGDRVTVIGAGAVGCLCAWIAGRIPGCVVELVDITPSRATVAASLGVRFATPDTAQSGADLVLHASATPAGLALALEVAGFESRIIELSWYGDGTIPVPLGASFHSRRLRIESSQVGVVARTQRSRWDVRRRMALALSLLADDSLDALITGESAFEELPAIMPALAGSAGDTICHRVRY